ncbi:MAG: RidA family protein [Myxococcota bacterium]
MKAEAVHTPDAPAAIGPYSQAIALDGLVFTSGQIALDPRTGALVEGDIEAQTERVMSNLEAVLQAANSGLDQIVKSTVFLLDMNDFQRFNAIYAARLGNHRPARSTVQVSRLPRDARVEIEVIALRNPSRL